MTAKIYSFPPPPQTTWRGDDHASYKASSPWLSDELASYVDEINDLIDNAPKGQRPAIFYGCLCRLSDAIAEMLPHNREALILLSRVAPAVQS